MMWCEETDVTLCDTFFFRKFCRSEFRTRGYTNSSRTALCSLREVLRETSKYSKIQISFYSGENRGVDRVQCELNLEVFVDLTQKHFIDNLSCPEEK